MSSTPLSFAGLPWPNPAPVALSVGRQDMVKRRLLTCFLLAPSLISFKGQKGSLELSFQPAPEINEVTFSLQHRAWGLTPVLNSGTAGLYGARASDQ